MTTKAVVMGAGFAGIQAAGVLGRASNVSTVLLDRNDYTTMLPALPDVAAGFMDPSLVRSSIRDCVCPEVTCTTTRVTSVDLDERVVTTDSGEYHYDGLVIAAGSVASPVKLPESQARFFHCLASLEDALTIQRDFSEYLQRVERPQLLFAGTGYTGIELAVSLKARAEAVGADCGVTMVDHSERILPFCSASERRYVADFLSSRGIAVRNGVTVTAMEEDGALLSDGATIAAPFAVWSAGSTSALSSITGKVQRIRDGRIIVNSSLQIENYPEVFVAGDACALLDRRGHTFRKSVNYAYYEGKAAGNNCARRLGGRKPRSYTPLDAGWVIPLHEGGVGRLFSFVRIRGTLPLRLHYFMCGYRNYGRNRLRTARIAITLFKRKDEFMRQLLTGIIGASDDRNPAFVVLRIFTGIGMMTHGYGKVFGNPERFIATVQRIGFPFPSFFAFAASFSEFFGALLLCLGLGTRVWAFFIAFTMGVAAFIVHGGAPFARRELALLYLFVAVLFMCKGGGTFSFDYLIGRKLREKNRH